MTIFERIAQNELPSFKIMENDEFLAVLDKFPMQTGQIVVFPKNAAPSKFSEVETTLLLRSMEFAQQVARLLEEKLDGVLRVTAKVEGLEIEHFHIKLYPLTRGGVEGMYDLDGGEVPDSMLKELQAKITTQVVSREAV